VGAGGGSYRAPSSAADGSVASSEAVGTSHPAGGAADLRRVSHALALCHGRLGGAGPAGGAVAAETVRRGRQARGWEWPRAKRVAKDDAPQRVAKLARLRYAFEHLQVGLALCFAAEWAISWLPKVGYQWMPKGTQVAVRTPGTNAKRYVAGALDLAPGRTQPCSWYRNPSGLFLAWRARLERTYPGAPFSSLSVVVDHSKIPQAAEVDKWLAAPPRVKWRFLPTSCPKAPPIERAFGEVHEKCTRNPTRKRMGPLVRDVEQQLGVNGPWPSILSALYYTPEVTAAVQALIAAETPQGEISQLAA
jgi:hypothetical protein